MNGSDEGVKDAERREREALARARLNKPLMDQMIESLAAVHRGEKGIPGADVFREAHERRGGI